MITPNPEQIRKTVNDPQTRLTRLGHKALAAIEDDSGYRPEDRVVVLLSCRQDDTHQEAGTAFMGYADADGSLDLAEILTDMLHHMQATSRAEGGPDMIIMTPSELN